MALFLEGIRKERKILIPTSANSLFINAIEKFLLAVYIKLGVGVLYVSFYRILRKIEFRADSGFASSSREERYNLYFSISEKIAMFEGIKPDI